MAEQRNRTRPGFNHKVIFYLSIAAIILGVISLCTGVAGLVFALTRTCQYPDYSSRDHSYDTYNYRYGFSTTTTTKAVISRVCSYYRTYSSPGIWCGLMFIASGIIGVFAVRRKTTCFIVTLLVLNAVSTWTALCGIVISIGSQFEERYDQVNEYPFALRVLNSIVTVTSLAVFIMQWVEFGFACRAICCNGKSGYPKMKKWQSHSYQPLPSHHAEPYLGSLGQPPYVGSLGQPQPTAGHIAPQVAGSEPVYLVQGHRIIGVLPHHLQQSASQTPAQPQSQA